MVRILFYAIMKVLTHGSEMRFTHSFLKVKKYIFFFLPRDDSFGWTLEGNYVLRKNSLEKGRNTIASDTSRHLFAEPTQKSSTTQAMRVSNVEA